MAPRYVGNEYDFRLTPEVKRHVREAYKGVCQYCMGHGADHVDHIVPSAHGGCDNLANYILACDSCNQRKGKGDIAPQYLALITSIADRHKDWIRSRILRPSKNAAMAIRVGLTPQLYHTVRMSNPPTAFDVRVLQFWIDLFIDLKAKMNAAKPKNQAG